MRDRQKDNNETNAKEERERKREKKRRESCHHYELGWEGKESTVYMCDVEFDPSMSNRVERTTTELAKRRSIHPDVGEKQKKTKDKN